MRMTDFIVRESISPQLAATTKEGAIREMVENLRAVGYFQNCAAEDLIKAIMKREQLGSTGIGRGVAIPHAKHANAERLIGTLGISQPGVQFQSLDGEPVHVLVLLISPQDRPGPHLQALESVSRSLRDDGFVRALREGVDRETLWKLLNDQ
jgi:mannitol/fructose-specific phosphotransferase system IIA component (Ntr-type)